MAGLRRMCSHRQQIGCSNIPYSPVFHLYLVFNNGVTYYCLHDHGFLGEYEELYSQCQKKPFTVFVTLKRN